MAAGRLIDPDSFNYFQILNACVPSKQWKSVSWVFKQLRKGGLRPNGATYGLAMEVNTGLQVYNLCHLVICQQKACIM